MFRTAKIATIALALIASTTLMTTSVQAAERPVTVPGCKTPTSKSSTPKTVKQPAASAKPNTKSLTLKTNCGDIVI